MRGRRLVHLASLGPVGLVNQVAVLEELLLDLFLLVLEAGLLLTRWGLVFELLGLPRRVPLCAQLLV